MELLCPACARQLSIPQTPPGTALRCPFCHSMFQVAAPAPAMQAAGPAPYSTPGPAFPQPDPAPAGPIVQDRPVRAVRRKKNDTTLIVACGGLLVLVAGLMIGVSMWLFGGSGNSTAVSNDPEQIAQQKAREFVSVELRLPANAQFASGGDRVKSLPGGRWVVDSHVDVPSRLGNVYLRQKWTADLTDAAGQWTLERLEVDGETLVARSSPAGSPAGSNRNWLDRRGSSADTSGPDRSTRWAVQRVAGEIRESAQLQKTLVVWLIDRSMSVRPQLQEVLGHIDTAMGELKPGAGDDPQLRMAVVSFGSDVKFPLEQPSGDAAVVSAAMESIEEDSSGKELTFTAIGQAVQKYQNFRTEKNGYVLLVVVSDEVGDDEAKLDETVALVRLHGMAVHAIGVAAPFGRAVAPAQQALEGQGPADASKPSLVRQGPESRALERIDVAAMGGEIEPMSSSFGPFALTRLCQSSGGEYLACHDFGVAANSGYSGWGSSIRTKTSFDPVVMRRYAPDYVSDAEYRQILAANKACQALHEAAKLPRADVLVNTNTNFPKRDEAAFKRSLDSAQRDAARFEPKLLAIYEALKQGEADRPKLTSPRWQAGYDLAMGRILAARVRTEGYNAMLAKIKSAGNFSKPENDTWVLVESETIGAGSAFEKMLEQSRMYLNRVVKDHAGTPWAAIAERELAVKAGWQWTEADQN